MERGATSARHALARSRAFPGAAFLEREAPLVLAVGVYVALIATLLPQMIVQDSWLTLAMGREIFQHGLPHTETITVWAHGDHWTDQQWLAQCAFYALDRLGGLRLVMLTHALLLSAAFAGSLAAARARGASHKSILLVATVGCVLAPWALQMRAQSFAPLLFVGVLWLLVSDGKAPSRRVLLVLPLLILWANIHGTVLLGALLVALRGITRLLGSPSGTDTGARGRKLDSVLLLAAPALILVSPYGLSMAGYYRQMLVAPQLRTYVQEWQVSAPSLSTAAFYVAAFAATALVARGARNLTRFEVLALAILLVSALSAIRSIVWFGLACMIILPVLVDHELPTRPWRLSIPARTLAAVGVAVIIVFAGFAATRPAAWFEKAWPTQGVAAISRELATPNTRVIADDRHADWLLWQLPQLRGRLANDVRFELYSTKQLKALIAYQARSEANWRAAGAGYAVSVLDAQSVSPSQARAYGRLLYSSAGMIVVRNRSAGSARAR
jgi:hypothetical protein